MKPYRSLFLICLAALIVRVACLAFIQHPGIGDPNHYYMLGTRLVAGQGFTVDYIWQYNQPPANVTHPDDHWMPLSGVLAALGMLLFGEGVHQAILPFILIGSLLPIVAYAAARQFELSKNASLFCAAVCAFLPEFVLNSVRTDTTIPNTFLVCISIVLLVRGLKQGGWLNFVLSGVAGGLSYLTRNDGALLLPMAALTGLIYWYWGGRMVRWHFLLGALIAAVLVVTPWLMRNQRELGTLSPPGLSSMFFFTEQREHYAYGRTFTLQTMLASQSIPQLIGKRVFELAAAIKLMYTTLDVLLPVAVAGGLLLLLAARDKPRILTLSPTLILLLGFLVAYPILIPLKSQSGSFKKAYLTIIPMLLPLAGYALDKVITEVRWRNGVMLLTLVFLLANAVELVRADARFTNTYLDVSRQVVKQVNVLPDTNGDGRMILMAQDQFMLSFLGVPSVMIPFEDRDTVLQVAARYHVDYLLMPPDRPSLDPIYDGSETDPRFKLAASVPGTTYQLYSLDLSSAN